MQPSTFSVLIVEDTHVQALQFKSMLESIGCQVTWVDTGESGVKMANRKPFDLILLDIELPDISGFEVLERLKNNRDLSNTPMVMLTTHDEADHVLHGLDLGAIDYIPKDVFAEVVLRETVRSLLENGNGAGVSV
ncbi:response regulator [Anaerolineales bacterium HSG6]|nr:response regulator [Anaerolineales bacterium HSG6]MDM8529789.1 response regulator [Anaerolineales bacterium HSG25]